MNGSMDREGMLTQSYVEGVSVTALRTRGGRMQGTKAGREGKGHNIPLLKA